jgi:CRP-like cAMP-binding protein
VAEHRSLSTVEKVLFLKTVDIFARAAIEELGRVAGLTEEVKFQAGETIYREGETVEAIYIIFKGRAAVQRKGNILREMGERDTLGVLAALDLNSALHTVTAREPIHALKLNVQDFQDILSLDFELVKAVFRALTQRLREVS